MGDTNPLQAFRISLVELADAERRGLIITKYHPTVPLSIHNYTNRAFNSRSQTGPAEALRLPTACRTLVTETSTGEIVSRSFSKFFNHHEQLAYTPSGKEHSFLIEEKVDGSVISLFCYKDEWLMASRASLNSQASPHLAAAWRILGNKYPSVLRAIGKDGPRDSRGGNGVLDKEKTYVFELVDPTMRVKVRYTKADLVLLAIIAKDGQEPPPTFDWNTLKLPFTRPKMHSSETLDLKGLAKLNRANEEGFVVKFYATAADTYPQRLKVKFDSYLKSGSDKTSTADGVVVDSLAKISLSQNASQRNINSSRIYNFPTPATPPTPSTLLHIYTSHRLTYPHFTAFAIDPRMETCKAQYLAHLAQSDFLDDYGGDAWLEQIAKTWVRIHALYSLHEESWRDTVAMLESEGFRAGTAKSNGTGGAHGKQAFEKRIKKADVDRSFRDVLVVWFELGGGGGDKEGREQERRRLVKLVLDAMDVPKDLRSEDIVVLG